MKEMRGKSTYLTAVIVAVSQLVSAESAVLNKNTPKEVNPLQSPQKQVYIEASNEEYFELRMCLGWIERISSRPFDRFSKDIESRWNARCGISDELVKDYEDYFAFMKQENINYMLQWGLFGENWPADPQQGISAERQAKINKIITSAHVNGVKFLVGFSPNFQMRKIINKHPHLAKKDKDGNILKDGLCLADPCSYELVLATFRLVFDDYNLDGIGLEFSGRCGCDKCSKMTESEYCRFEKMKMIELVRNNWPDKTIIVSARQFPGEGILECTQQMARFNVILDVFREPEHQINHADIADVKFAMRSFASSHWITPPWSWERLRWFLPQTLQEAKAINKARQYGAAGYVWCSSPIANPGEEITSRFRARLLQYPGMEPRECLTSVLRDIYKPKTNKALNVLADVVEEAEKAYPWVMLPNIMHTEVFDYLNRLDENQRLAYGKKIKQIRAMFQGIIPYLEAQEKSEQLLKCLDNVLADVENPPTYPEEVLLRRGTIPAKRPVRN